MKKIIYSTVALILIFNFPLAGESANKPPKEIYKLYNEALRAGNFQVAMSFHIAANRQKLDKMKSRDKMRMYHMLKAMAPKEYKLTKEKITGGKAYIILEIESETKITVGNKTTSKMEKYYSKVRFIKEKGNWRIVKESVQDKPFTD